MTLAQSIAPSRGPGGKTPPARRNLPASLWTLYQLTLRQYLHGKRWMIMAALFLLPAGLGLLVRMTAHDAPLFNIEFVFAFMFIPQALLPLVALIYASGMIQDEQEEQTITYLLIRPIPKWAIYIVKLLATLTTTVCLTAIFTAITYAAIYTGVDNSGGNVLSRCLMAMAIHSLAVMTYCCLFGMMSLITQRTLIFGILYTAIVEGLFANMPLSIRLVTVIYYTRVIAFRAMQFASVAPARDIATENGANIAADAWQFDLVRDPAMLTHPQRSTCILVLLIASLVFTAIAAFLCTRREFHVKTPEKN